MTANPISAIPTEFTDCDREPIHIPGTIQPFGALIACSRSDWTVTHVSANAVMLADPPSQILGKSLTDVVGHEAAHLLKNALSASVEPALPGRVFSLGLADGLPYHAAIHAHGSRVIVDFERSLHRSEATTPLFLARNMLIRMQQAQSIDDVCQVAVRQLRALIDCDRALVYQFLPDGSGSVLAEARVDGVESFMGHHYPASDIPRQARELYAKNWLRLIASVDDQPVPILALPDHAPPLDLTYSALRSVSPVHIEYLRNMGVAASLSISIIVGGELWGLIACHNYSPRAVPVDTRMAAEFFGQAFSLQLQTLARADAAELLRNARVEIDRIVSEIPTGVPLPEALGQKLPEVKSVVACDGAALWIGNRLTSTGGTPPHKEIPEIAKAIAGTGQSGVFETSSLGSLLPSAAAYAAEASGVMAIPLSRHPGQYLMLFRREFVQTINWAGNPQKPVAQEGGQLKLSPRRSFAVWQEEVKGRSREWVAHDRLTGEALRIALLEVVLKYSELVAEERERAGRRQRLQAEEFNHRVKNALTLIGAMVSQSQVRRDDMGAFVADLQGRIKSLALAHDLATKPGVLELGELLRIELKPHGEASLSLEGPSVWLGDETSGIVALLVHELVTNASKYGALSAPSGKISVRWQLDAEGGCSLHWTERGGPVVTEPSRTGFGMLLVTRQVPFELGGRSAVRYAAAGLEVDLWLPPTALMVERQREGGGNPQSERSSEQPLVGLKGLVVEDSLIVALELERRLRRLGCAEVTITGGLDQAQSYARDLALDFAVLDVDLKGVESFPVARALLGRGIPIVFSTGYSDVRDKPTDLSAVPQLNKPYDNEELVAALLRARTVGGGGG